MVDIRSQSRLSQTRHASRELEKAIGFQPSSLPRRGSPEPGAAESASSSINQRWQERQRESETKRATAAAMAPPLVTPDSPVSPTSRDFVQPVLDQVYEAVARMEESNISLSDILSTVLRRTIGEIVATTQRSAREAQKGKETAEWLLAQREKELEATVRRNALERERTDAIQQELQEQIQSLKADLADAQLRERALQGTLDEWTIDKQASDADIASLKAHNERLAESRSAAIASSAELQFELVRLAATRDATSNSGLDAVRSFHPFGADTPGPRTREERQEAARVRDELVALLTPGQDAREVLKMFDTDSTGALNVLQFRDAVRNGCQISADQISDADLLKLFAAVDQDNGGTGSVPIDELGTSSALVELLTPTHDPEQLLKKFDTDSTGALNVLQFCEAVRSGAQISADQISDADLLKLFAAMDQEQGATGVVSIETLGAFVSGGALPAVRSRTPPRGGAGVPGDNRSPVFSASTASVELETLSNSELQELVRDQQAHIARVTNALAQEQTDRSIDNEQHGVKEAALIEAGANRSGKGESLPESTAGSNSKERATPSPETVQAVAEFDRAAQQQELLLASLAAKSAAQDDEMNRIASTSAAADDKLAAQLAAGKSDTDKAFATTDGHLADVKSGLREILSATPHDELVESHENMTVELQQVNHQLAELQQLNDQNSKELLAKNEEIAQLLVAVEAVVSAGASGTAAATQLASERNGKGGGEEEEEGAQDLSMMVWSFNPDTTDPSDLEAQTTAIANTIATSLGCKPEEVELIVDKQGFITVAVPENGDESAEEAQAKLTAAVKAGLRGIDGDEISIQQCQDLAVKVPGLETDANGDVTEEAMRALTASIAEQAGISADDVQIVQTEPDGTVTFRVLDSPAADAVSATEAVAAVEAAIASGALAMSLKDKGQEVTAIETVKIAAKVAEPSSASPDAGVQRYQARAAQLEAQVDVLQKLANTQKTEIARLSKQLAAGKAHDRIDAVQRMISGEQADMDAQASSWSAQEAAWKAEAEAQEAAWKAESEGDSGTTAKGKGPPPLQKLGAARLKTESAAATPRALAEKDYEIRALRSQVAKLLQDSGQQQQRSTQEQALPGSAGTHDDALGPPPAGPPPLRRLGSSPPPRAGESPERHYDQGVDVLRQPPPSGEEDSLEDHAHKEWFKEAQAAAINEVHAAAVQQTRDEHLPLIEQARSDAARHREAATSHKEDAAAHKAELRELRQRLGRISPQLEDAQQQAIELTERHASAHVSLQEQTARAEAVESELRSTQVSERNATAETERITHRLSRTQAELSEVTRDHRQEKQRLEDARELHRTTEREKEAALQTQRDTAAALTTIKAKLESTEAAASAAAAKAAAEASAAAMAASEAKHRETKLEMDLGATRVTLARLEESFAETQASETALQTERDELAVELTAANEIKEQAVEESRKIREEWDTYAVRLHEAQSKVSAE